MTIAATPSVDALADLLPSPSAASRAEDPGRALSQRHGTVTAVAPGPPSSVTVTIGATSVAGVRHLSSYSPVAGDVVVVHFAGPDPLVIGTVRTAAAAGVGEFISPGLELYHPSSSPYLDFHRAANPAGDGGADYNVRLINDASGVLSLIGGQLDVGLARMATHPVYPSFAWFGHESMQGGSNYGFMQNADETLVNGPLVDIRVNGANKFRVLPTENRSEQNLYGTGYIQAAGAMYVSNWFRSFDVTGWHNETYGGGIRETESAWVDVYAGKGFRADNEIRALDGMIHRWNGVGGHGIAGNKDAGWAKGWMTRNDGALWPMFSSAVSFRGTNGEYFYFYEFGDVRFNVPTVAPGDPDLRIAASSQLLRNASQRKYKKDIVDLEREDNPVWRLRPRRYHWKDDAREHGARFNARHPIGCPGFIAEEMYEVATDTVDIDTTTGEPLSPAAWPLFAYITSGMQELNERLKKVESAPDKLEEGK